MSHLPQRKDKTCLNCGTETLGVYCHNCGQENIEPKETVWHLLNHFFQDVTHFDGKFFSSLKYIITKPGFLSKEYITGRRVKYLHPIRMYLFTSAIFFIIFFSLVHLDSSVVHVGGTNKASILQLDSASFSEYTKAINNGKPMTKEDYKKYADDKGKFNIAPGSYKSKQEYDSLLKTGKKKHNWFERQLVYKQLEFQEKYNSDPKLIVPALMNKFLHSIPHMLFVLLPLFALGLKLLYVRRKEFYYVDHAIFTLHFYIFIFIDLLVITVFTELMRWLHWKIFNYIIFALIIAIFFYLYKALRNFYHQRRAKTILKFFLLLLMLSFIEFLLFICFAFLSIFGL